MINSGYSAKAKVANNCSRGRADTVERKNGRQSTKEGKKLLGEDPGSADEEVDEANERPKVCSPANLAARIVAKQASPPPQPLSLFFTVPPSRLGFAVFAEATELSRTRQTGGTSRGHDECLSNV